MKLLIALYSISLTFSSGPATANCMFIDDHFTTLEDSMDFQNLIDEFTKILPKSMIPKEVELETSADIAYNFHTEKVQFDRLVISDYDKVIFLHEFSHRVLHLAMREKLDAYTKKKFQILKEANKVRKATKKPVDDILVELGYEGYTTLFLAMHELWADLLPTIFHGESDIMSDAVLDLRRLKPEIDENGKAKFPSPEHADAAFPILNRRFSRFNEKNWKDIQNGDQNPYGITHKARVKIWSIIKQRKLAPQAAVRSLFLAIEEGFKREVPNLRKVKGYKLDPDSFNDALIEAFDRNSRS